MKKELGPIKYTIKNNSVYIWNTEDADDSEPRLYQPFDFDGTPFTSIEDAEQWVVNYLKDFHNYTV